MLALYYTFTIHFRISSASPATVLLNTNFAELINEPGSGIYSCWLSLSLGFSPGSGLDSWTLAALQ